MGRWDYPVALNKPVTVSVRRQNEDTLIVRLEVRDLLHVTDELELMIVHVSGLAGELSLQRE